MISAIITLGPLAPAQRAPVAAALRRTLDNPGIAALHVLSEADAGWMQELAEPDSGPETGRLQLHPVDERPSFAMLIGFANRLLALGAGPVMIMNADVALAGPEDVVRIEQGLAAVDTPAAPPVFALARHETTADGPPRIDLYEPSGLPNLISADAWIFARPVTLNSAPFYCPGQMNCDMMLAFDLVTSGYAVFNPCLDVTLLHFEPSKDDTFYDEKNQELGVQELLWRHIRDRGDSGFNYYRIPWVSTAWLQAGYQPAPLRTHGRTLLVADIERGAPTAALRRAQQIAAGDGRDCEWLVYGDTETVFQTHRALLTARSDLRLVPVNQPLEDVRRHFLTGTQYNADRVAMVHDLSALSEPILAQNDCVFVAHGTGGVAPRDVTGCTLVTSVFRSDDFLQGFVNNCRALDGYGARIEHIFVVAALSETELAVLDGLLAQQPNVVVIWNRSDPGLYNCWNLGIQAARHRYISNANVDDLRDPAHVMRLVEVLETQPRAHVAASALNPFYDFPADGTLPHDRPGWYSDQPGAFGFFDLARLTTTDSGAPRLEPHNMPHCMPVWRRDLHDRYGWFDEAHYGTYADWAFWMKTLVDGGCGWLHPEPLGFYFVNPTSHNRRGTELERLHGVIEAEFMPAFQAQAQGALPPPPALPQVPRKLALSGHDTTFGQHRNSFNRLIGALEPLDAGPHGILLLPFIERYFVWGDAPGEAASFEPKPILRDWIGILHVPFDAPEWFESKVSPERFFATPLWQQSLPHCRGLITLARDLEDDLRQAVPGVPVLSVRHPVEMDVHMFDPAAYQARPQVVQVGDWLRKLQAIHRMRAPGHKRIMLLKAHTQAFLGREIETLGDDRDPDVDMRLMVPNDAYDHLLATSVVVCLLYGTAANNVVIECIARATPILINPLPAVVEYLGPDYPLYACTEAEADRLLNTPGRVDAAHAYLKRRRLEIDLSYEGFARDIAASPWYVGL